MGSVKLTSLPVTYNNNNNLSNISRIAGMVQFNKGFFPVKCATVIITPLLCPL